MNNKFKKLLVLFLGLIASLFVWQYSQAQTDTTNTTASGVNNPDAIAVRIIPNPKHYSISRWYANQGFQGSPQSLIVDGYNAIRDGRTVYINAANVDSAHNIYTNIYLISYNQNSSANTVDILGQIISHWKFNDNLNNISGSQPTCSISNLSCNNNNDCASGQSCITSGSAAGTCRLQAPVDCMVDTDCPSNFFCNSLKAQVVRDVKRMGQLEELKIALTNFKSINGHYPLLTSGSYLPGNSVSLWPSWSQSLLSDLALAPTSVDPINHLGSCPGFSQSTCWNADSKQFFSRPANGATLVLPTGSYALAYAANNTGSDYHICATLESKALGYNFAPIDPFTSNCVTATGIGASGATTNRPPQLQDRFLQGQAHQEFNGFIRVSDVDNDPLTWSLQPAPGSVWSDWSNNGQSNQPPILKDTSNPYQKKVYAQLAGDAGTYNMVLKVDDGRGGVLTTTTPIVISFPSIAITAQNSVYSLDSGTPFNYSFSFSGDGLTTIPAYSLSGAANTYSVTKLSGPFDLLASLTKNISVLSTNNYQVTYSTTSLPGLKLIQGAKFVYEIKVTDSNNQTVTKDFSLKISPSTLQFSLSCPPSVRVLNPYSCQLSDNSQNSTFKVDGLPQGLSLDGDKITGSPSQVGQFTITVDAQNAVGASAQDSFNLAVNTYCGDGIKQTPNSEGAGGPNNNGNEACDGADGVVTDPLLSSLTAQYACQPGPGAVTTYPILTNNQCVFATPLNGGGYCGDGYCEALSASGQTLETCDNCAQDCGVCAVDNTPRVMTWCGKVNQHWDINAEIWETDPDGFSGCHVNLLDYCSKFYPATSSVTPYKMETSNSWRNGGNVDGPFTATRMSYQCVQGPDSSSNVTKASISGTVSSYAHYGSPSQPLNNVRIIFSDASGVSVAITNTDASGHYQVQLPISTTSSPKTYQAVASLPGYSDTIQTLTPTGTTTLNFLMSIPTYSSVNKIQLTWGAAPADLDSHLTFSTSSTFTGTCVDPSSGETYTCPDANAHPAQFYHIWWPPEHRQAGSSTLDIDITQGYGPENIRINKLIANNYLFDVYNYSRCYLKNTQATFGSATVTLYNSQNGVLKVFHADPNQTSCYWHVFGLDSQGNVTTINKYNDTGPQAHL